MNQYPAKAMMDEMAKYGRYGDTMLVHMNPIEVAGIASLSPTGSLTTNPVTGQPEAFLPLLAPALGVLGGALKLGALGTAALTGIGTAAVTGDLKRGLLAGLTSGIMSGVGEGIGEALRGGADAVTQGTIDTAGTAFAGGAEAAGGAASAIQPDVLQTSPEIFKAAEMGLPGAPGAGLTSSQMSLVGADASGLAPTPEPSGISALSSGVNQFVGGLSPTQATLMAGIPAGQLAQMDVEDEMAANARRLEEESYASEMEAYGDLQSAYRAAQPGVGTGTSPYRSLMSQRTQQPYMPTIGFAEGGSTDPLVVEPNEEEARVLAMAGRNTALSPADQRILESYYARRNAALVQQQEEEDAAQNIYDGVLRIPDGTTNQEALDILKRYGLISPDDYNWFKAHLKAIDKQDGVYLASNSFPGLDKYLEENAFAENEAARVRRVIGVLDQATSEEGIKEEDLGYLTEGAFTGFGYYGGGYNAGYGGIDPVSIQAGLRPDYSVAPPLDYRTGFEPEFSYFQEDPTNVRIPTRAFRPTTAGVTSEGEYFDPILDREAYLQQIRDYYTMLANYTPAAVEQPDQPEPVPDDPDVIGEPIGEEPVAEEPVADEPPAYGPYADRYDAWRRNADFILDKVRRGVPLSASEQEWHNKYKSGLIVDPRYRPEGFQVPASYEEAMAFYQSGGYEGVPTVEYGSLEDIDRGDEERYPVAGQPAKTKQDSGDAVGIPGVDPRPLAGADKSTFLKILDAVNRGEIVLGGDGQELGFGPESQEEIDARKEKTATEQQTKNVNYILDKMEEGTATEENIDFINRMSGSKYDETTQERIKEAQGGRSRAKTAGTREGPEDYDGVFARIAAARGFAEGGEVALRTPMGETSVPAGGIANMPTEFSASMPTKEEFDMVASAVLGQVENSDVIIDMFVRKYGPDMFAQIREMVLRSIVPNAQTEGMIQGQGGGMDDMVGGMIGDQQPVAVSPGEYIVPADVVSGLGDGSSDAGADELDQMMARVRMARGGTTEQAPAIDAKKVMPI
jgi:hypothetical protein